VEEPGEGDEEAGQPDIGPVADEGDGGSVRKTRKGDGVESWAWTTTFRRTKTLIAFHQSATCFGHAFLTKQK